MVACSDVLELDKLRPKERLPGKKPGPKAVDPMLERLTPPNEMDPRSGTETLLFVPNVETDGNCTTAGCWASTRLAAYAKKPTTIASRMHAI